MAVPAAYIIINAACVIGYVLFIVGCSITFRAEERHKLHFLSYILIPVVLLAGVNVTLDSVLLAGIGRRRRRMVLSWVVWYGALTALVSVGWLAGAVFWIYTVAVNPASQLALGVFYTCVHCLLGFAIIPLMWFCFARVTSYLATLTPPDDSALISKLVRQNTRFGLVNLPPHEDEED